MHTALWDHACRRTARRVQEEPHSAAAPLQRSPKDWFPHDSETQWNTLERVGPQMTSGNV